MQLRSYRCSRFPHFSISRGAGIRPIQFLDQRFVARTEDEQAAIEGNEWFGSFITLEDAEPALEPEPQPEPDESEYVAAFAEVIAAPAAPRHVTISSQIREHFKRKKK